MFVFQTPAVLRQERRASLAEGEEKQPPPAYRRYVATETKLQREFQDMQRREEELRLDTCCNWNFFKKNLP